MSPSRRPFAHKWPRLKGASLSPRTSVTMPSSMSTTTRQVASQRVQIRRCDVGAVAGRPALASAGPEAGPGPWVCSPPGSNAIVALLAGVELANEGGQGHGQNSAGAEARPRVVDCQPARMGQPSGARDGWVGDTEHHHDGHGDEHGRATHSEK